MPKPNKENIITDILIELEKGIGYKDCFGLIKTKSDIARSTFSNYWKIANGRYSESQEEMQKSLAEQRTELEKKRLKKAILSKDEVLIELTKIGLGKLKLDSFGKLQPANFNERISAFKTMADLQGWKAPTKTDITTGGEKLINSNIDLSKLSDEALAEIEKAYTQE